jgi:hypothetical protein
MASGLVVSRGSPGSLPFSSGSIRSNRMTGSPSPCTKALMASSPPTRGSSRFAAALSLVAMVAAQSSPTERWPSRT